jgi:hypothetical protein
MMTSRSAVARLVWRAKSLPPTVRRCLVLAALLLVALAVRLHALGEHSLSFEEARSAHAAALSSLWSAATVGGGAPVYHALLHMVAQRIGDGETALRLLSVAIGLLTVALACRLACRHADASAGAWSVFLAGASPLLWLASRDATPLALLAALALVAAVAWERIVRSESAVPTAWIALGATELAALYTHRAGIAIALWINAVTLIAWAVQRGGRCPAPRRWWMGQAAVGLLCLPAVLWHLAPRPGAPAALPNLPWSSWASVADMWGALWSGSVALARQDPILATFRPEAPYLGLSGAALIVAVLARPWRRGAWPLVHAAVLGAALAAVPLVPGPRPDTSYLALVAPFVLVALGTGLARSPRMVQAAGVLVISATLLAVARDDRLGRPGRVDARAMAQYHAAELTEIDTVMAWSDEGAVYDLEYYWRRLGVKANRVVLPAGADLARVAADLKKLGRVSHVTRIDEAVPGEAMVDCVLGHGSTSPPRVHVVRGLADKMYPYTPSVLPQLEPRGADVVVGDVTAAALAPSALAADRAACLPVDLTLTRAVTGTLRAAVIARNALGWEIARADAPFAPSGPEAGGPDRSGARLTAWTLLRLPLGAPPGRYVLYLRVYDDPARPDGYPVRTTGVVRGGTDVAMAPWTALPGATWPMAAATSLGVTPGLVSGTELVEQGVAAELDLPYRRAVEVGRDMVLVAQSLDPDAPATVRPGDTLAVTFLWRGDGTIPYVDLADDDRRWHVASPPSAVTHDELTRDWREIRIPGDAEGGTATLRAPGDHVLGRLVIAARP